MKFTNLAALDADEIFKLTDYIQKFAGEEEDKRSYVLSHIGNFFLDLTLEQELKLCTCIDQRDYFGLSEFIRENPMIRVNLDGDSKAKEQNGYEVKALSLNTAYTYAKKAQQTNDVRQVINARELNCLKNVKEYPYSFERLKMLNEYRLPRTMVEPLEKYEAIQQFNCKRLLALAFEYFRQHPKNSRFLEYLFYYLDVVRLDIESKSDLTQEYTKTVTELFQYFDDKKVGK